MSEHGSGAQSNSAVRSVLSLASGTAIVRVLSSFGSLILAFWLSPSEFGVWASAVSACAILSSLTNFGVAQAYLAGFSGGLARTRRVAFFQNLSLSLIAIGLAFGYMVADRSEVALLVAILGASIPLQGDADLLYSEGVRQRRNGYTVRTQAIAALAKTAVGIIIAMITGSVAAIVISTLVYQVAMELLMLPLAKGGLVKSDGERTAIKKSVRFSWAVNAMLLSLPMHVPFLIAQFLVDSEFVGVLYLAFQVSLGISGMVAVPLNRVSVSAISVASPASRPTMATDLGGVFVAGTTVLCGVVTFLAYGLEEFLPSQWEGALAPAVVILASLPARILTPIADGFQQAQGRWWQGSAYSTVDMLGTTVASFAVLTGDIIIVAVALTAWKIVLGLIRSGLIFRKAGIRRLAILQGTTLVGAFLLILAPLNIGWMVLAILCGGLILYLYARVLRN